MSSASYDDPAACAVRVVRVRRAGRTAHYRLDGSHVRMLLDLALTHVGHTEGRA
ncbi:hypothetical protein AB0L06_39410 [Spirillospora sp. NPDC052269]